MDVDQEFIDAVLYAENAGQNPADDPDSEDESEARETEQLRFSYQCMYIYDFNVALMSSTYIQLL